jgi:CubicO group peptidase (beta-lactamase class C family)
LQAEKEQTISISTGVQSVIRAFRNQHAASGFPGGQLVVRHRGEVIIDEAIGVARGLRPDEATPPLDVTVNTLFPVYSCGKPIAALAIAMLEDRGQLDPCSPLGEVIPAFKTRTPRSPTILDVLTHRAGIHMPNALQDLDTWNDPGAMVQRLADAESKHPIGTLAYAPWEFGWILGEVVRRITGVSFDAFVQREMFQPLGLSNLRFGLASVDARAIAYTYWLGRSRLMVAGANVANRFEEIHNDARYLESKNPACALIATAGDLTLLYDFILRGGIAAGGTRLISADVLKRYTSKNVFAFDRSLNTFLSLGRGFVLGTMTPSMFGWWNTSQCFGHAGAFSSLAGADWRTQLSFAVLTNGNRGLADFGKRFIPLIHLLRRACGATGRSSGSRT